MTENSKLYCLVNSDKILINGECASDKVNVSLLYLHL